MSGPATKDVAVSVEWAVLSKHPERLGGYEVLAASGDRARAEWLMQAAYTGSPGEHRDGPDDTRPGMSFLARPEREPTSLSPLLRCPFTDRRLSERPERDRHDRA